MMLKAMMILLGVLSGFVVVDADAVCNVLILHEELCGFHEI